VICKKRLIDAFDKGSKKKIVKLPTETVEYYSRKAGSGYGLGELEAKREVFSVKRKVN
jgi:hypothetical protein